MNSTEPWAKAKDGSWKPLCEVEIEELENQNDMRNEVVVIAVVAFPILLLIFALFVNR